MSITYSGDYIQDTDGGVLRPSSSVMRNRIINGAMVLNQRGFSGTPTDGAYTLDRWVTYVSQASKFTLSQNAGSVTPPVGFTNYLGITSSSAYTVGAGEVFLLSQIIEGYNAADLSWGTANGKTVTLSFQVYSSLTGTFGGSIRNSAGNQNYPFSYTVSSANTWTSISVTIPAPSNGSTWNTTNGQGIFVVFSLGSGSTYSGTAGAWSSSNYYSATGATSVVGTSGATFYITGVQLEVGSNATGFEYRQYQQELALCQRYYWKKDGSVTYATIGSGVAPDTATVKLAIDYPVTMRGQPTFSYGGTIYLQANGLTSVASINSQYATAQAGQIIFNTSSAVNAGTAFIGFTNEASSTHYFQASAEL